AEGKAGRGRRHRGDPQVAEEALERGQGRARRGARDARFRETADEGGRERRRTDVRRGGLHPARGRLCRRDRRWVAEAPARDERAKVDAPQGRGRGARRAAGLHEGMRRPLFESRRRLRAEAQRRAALDGLPRGRAENLQVRRRRARRRGAVARPARHAPEERAPPRRDAPRTRPEVLGRPVPRGDDTGREALRETREGRRDRIRVRVRGEGPRGPRLGERPRDPLPRERVPILAGPGKGVPGFKLAADDRLVGAALFGDDEKRAQLVLVNTKGTEHTITRRYTPVSRGGKGFELIKRDRFVKAVPPEVTLVDFEGKGS